MSNTYEVCEKYRMSLGVGKMEIVLLVLLGLLVYFLIVQYNKLIRVRNRVKESFAAIDIYLQNRFDTLTKLAETVVSYTDHERETLQRITELRQNAKSQTSDEAKVHAYNEIDRLLGGIAMQVENYPELKANENYLQLQRAVNDLEEKLAASRRTYNANVTTFNTMLQIVPTKWYGKVMGFQRKNLLHIEADKKKDVHMGQ